MFIRITRLLLIIITSIFLGMCIVWWVMYAAKGQSLGMLRIGLFGSILLISAILFLQYWENRTIKREQRRIEEKRIAAEKEKANEMKNNV
jgi:hypothetical protein